VVNGFLVVKKARSPLMQLHRPCGHSQRETLKRISFPLHNTIAHYQGKVGTYFKKKPNPN